MSLLKQIEDKGAVLQWSPVASDPNFVVFGTKVTKTIIFYVEIYIYRIFKIFDRKDSAGGGFEDYGGELELHSLDFLDSNTTSTVLGKAKAKYIYSLYNSVLC
jgi:hypothetical protein